MKKNIKVVMAVISIILIIIFMILLTIVYFKIDDSDNETDLFYKNISIKYVETSNITLVNGEPGDTLNKSFIIKNISDEDVYYDIELSNLVNNFSNPDDIVYSLYGSNNGAYIKNSIFPTTSSKIASNIKIEPNQEQTYTLNLTFLKTEEDQSNNLNKTISSKINIVKSNINEYYKSDTLLESILTNNEIKSESVIDFNKLENGLYYTNDTINGNKVFFFRGDNTLNNNLVFAGYCFKIYRTDENMNIKVVYSGNYENEKCNYNKVLDVSSFNDNSNYNAYVGYMYGSVSSNNYEDEHKNINSSRIKVFLDNWYISNISKYSSYISDSYYCNNRKLSNFKYNSTLYGKNGYSNTNTGYLSFKNIYFDNNPTLNCYNINDRFTINLDDGNNSLSYSVGLLSSDEIYLSGINNKSFLSTNYNYWTLTPVYYNGTNAYNYIVSNNKLVPKIVNEKYAVRPVITLKSNIKYVSGDGSLDSPYIIE